MQYFLVAVGGILGTLSRYKLSVAINSKTSGKFPLGIFIVNILGAFLLGLVLKYGDDKNVYTLLGDGFLGAFTTFSTFMVESFNLIKEKRYGKAIVYIGGSYLLGLLGFFIAISF